MAQTKTAINLNRRHAVIFLLLALSLYVILPQLGNFHDSLKLLRHPDFRTLAEAFIVTMLTYFLAAATYVLLAFKKLAYGKTLLVQLASLFVNRLLPAGVGALGMNYLYLRKSKHSTTEASAVVAANNLVGILGHTLLFATILVVSGKNLPPTHVNVGHNILLSLLVVGAIAALVLLTRLRLKIVNGLHSFLKQISSYHKRPLHLQGALITSMSLTLCTVSGLWFCLMAVGVHLAFVTIFIVFSLGLSVGTATPTPGGLGGLEAGLVAALVTYHVPSASALAGVLLYRLLTYWFSLAIGAVAFVVVRQHKLLKA